MRSKWPWFNMATFLALCYMVACIVIGMFVPGYVVLWVCVFGGASGITGYLVYRQAKRNDALTELMYKNAAVPDVDSRALAAYLADLPEINDPERRAQLKGYIQGRLYERRIVSCKVTRKVGRMSGEA